MIYFLMKKYFFRYDHPQLSNQALRLNSVLSLITACVMGL